MYAAGKYQKRYNNVWTLRKAKQIPYVFCYTLSFLSSCLFTRVNGIDLNENFCSTEWYAVAHQFYIF